MKKSRFSEEQIVTAVRQVELGVPVEEVCRKYGISQQTEGQAALPSIPVDAASKDRPGAVNRAFEILRAMMFRAEEWGLRERGTNPCLGIAKNPRNCIARFLDAEELAQLGHALDAREAEWPEAVAAIRLLALTGCRRSEVLNLRWRNIGADAINLRDSKTGPCAVPLVGPAPHHGGLRPPCRCALCRSGGDGRGNNRESDERQRGRVLVHVTVPLGRQPTLALHIPTLNVLQVLVRHDLGQSSADPFGNRRRYRISDGVVAETVDTLSLLLVDFQGQRGYALSLYAVDRLGPVPPDPQLLTITRSLH